MGSAFAGLKAGVLTGILYSGCVGAFNALLLYILKQDVIQFVSLHGCSGVQGSQQPTPEECFSIVISIYIPYFAFLTFIVSLFFAATYGRFFEYIPGSGYKSKALSISLFLLLTLLFIGLGGLAFEYIARVVLSIFNLIMTLFYAIVLGSLYKRYTRVVSFLSEDEKEARILVNGSDYTSKTRTLALNSTHTIRALTKGSSSFKEWAYSGGVRVEDPKSFETHMEVNGDGILKMITVKRRLKE